MNIKLELTDCVTTGTVCGELRSIRKRLWIFNKIFFLAIGTIMLLAATTSVAEPWKQPLSIHPRWSIHQVLS